MTTTIASAKEVYRFFDQGGERTPVLKGLSLEVAEGEFVCVMGPSGSGKSSLLHILSGLDRPDSGVVTLGGERLHELFTRTREIRRGVVEAGQAGTFIPMEAETRGSAEEGED